MNSPNVPRNAYTDAPEQHPNLILSSLQLLFWLFFRPTAWLNHVMRIRRRGSWGKMAWWRLLVQGYFILPFLAYLLIILAFWGLGSPVEDIVFPVAWRVASGVAIGIALNIVHSLNGMSWGVALGVAWGVALGVTSGVALGVGLAVTLGVVRDLTQNVVLNLAMGMAFCLVRDMAMGLELGVMSGIAFCVGVTLNWWRPALLYPFLAAWNILLYQLDKRRSGNKPSLLCWHSAFWDERQRLRLHGLDKHLVLAIERNPAEGKAAIDYLLDTNQRWAAISAQIELDGKRLKLESCSDIEAIRNAHHRLASGKLESPTSRIFGIFNMIGEDVDAALNHASAYNQRKALEDVVKNLALFLHELTISSDKYDVRFRPIADRWQQILTNHVSKLIEEAEFSQEVDNPYIFGVPLNESVEIFMGRTSISTRIEQLILDQRRPPLLLYGQRRMGKTSLLNNLGRLLPNSIIPMFVDFQGPVSSAKNNAGFLYNFAKSMVDSARRQSAITLPRLTREDIAPDPFTCFDEWLDRVEDILDQNTALLALDEFEALDSAITKGRFDEEEVLGMLRHLIQHRPRFKILLAGSHTLEEFQRWASYLINVQILHISYLKEPEARQLIECPVKDFALRYEPDAVQRVLDLTRCHPCLVQLLCAEIVALKNDRDPSVRRLATLADVEDAVPQALETGSLFFADIQNNQVDKLGLAILRFIAARGEGAIVAGNTIAQEFAHAGDRPLNLLLRRELLEEVDGGYRFQVELIRRWFAS